MRKIPIEPNYAVGHANCPSVDIFFANTNVESVWIYSDIPDEGLPSSPGSSGRRVAASFLWLKYEPGASPSHRISIRRSSGGKMRRLPWRSSRDVEINVRCDATFLGSQRQLSGRDIRHA